MYLPYCICSGMRGVYFRIQIVIYAAITSYSGHKFSQFKFCYNRMLITFRCDQQTLANRKRMVLGRRHPHKMTGMEA